MEELLSHECAMVGGGDRNLGSLYQYTGEDSDRTAGERFSDQVGFIMKTLFDAFIEGWH